MAAKNVAVTPRESGATPSTVPQAGRGSAVRVQKPTYSRKWKCPRCSHTVSHSYESLAEIGTPYCADCEIEMEMI